MKRNETKSYAPLMKLRPHQAALLESFFSLDSKREILLRGDVGLGKKVALIALAERLLRERPSARVLFLVPKVLQVHIAEKLHETNTPMEIVDRYRFREMLDSAVDGDIWPSGKVIVLSRDFAKKLDIRNSLANTHWNLVIVDEAHTYGGSRGELLRIVGDSAERMILSSTIPFMEQNDSPLADDITVVEWRREQVVDHDGYLIDDVPRPALHEVVFSLSPPELSLLDKVNALCRMIEPATSVQNFLSKLLLRSFQSSPSALESVLQGLEERSQNLDELALSTDVDLPEEVYSTSADIPVVGKVVEVAASVIQEIDDLDRDSKLDAFNGLLNRIVDARNSSGRVCVTTEYVSTLYYLAAEVESRGTKCQLMHGRMSANDRQSSIVQFNESGGVLITTIGQLQGFELIDVTDLVFYDLPSNKNALWVVLSRFDRVGRSNQLNVHVLVPDNNTKVIMDESLGLLREILIES